jgi:hypothetical protein
LLLWNTFTQLYKSLMFCFYLLEAHAFCFSSICLWRIFFFLKIYYFHAIYNSDCFHSSSSAFSKHCHSNCFLWYNNIEHCSSQTMYNAPLTDNYLDSGWGFDVLSNTSVHPVGIHIKIQVLQKWKHVCYFNLKLFLSLLWKRFLGTGKSTELGLFLGKQLLLRKKSLPPKCTTNTCIADMLLTHFKMLL